jgi:hypothetical protein
MFAHQLTNALLLAAVIIISFNSAEGFDADKCDVFVFRTQENAVSFVSFRFLPKKRIVFLLPLSTFHFTHIILCFHYILKAMAVRIVSYSFRFVFFQKSVSFSYYRYRLVLLILFFISSLFFSRLTFFFFFSVVEQSYVSIVSFCSIGSFLYYHYRVSFYSYIFSYFHYILAPPKDNQWTSLYCDHSQGDGNWPFAWASDHPDDWCDFMVSTVRQNNEDHYELTPEINFNDTP